MTTLPESVSNSPVIILIIVDLPVPLGPIKAILSFSFISKETGENKGTPLYSFTAFCTWTIIILSVQKGQ